MKKVVSSNKDRINRLAVDSNKQLEQESDGQVKKPTLPDYGEADYLWKCYIGQILYEDKARIDAIELHLDSLPEAEQKATLAYYYELFDLISSKKKLNMLRQFAIEGKKILKKDYK